jgi:putative ABC transport system permease protein
VRSVAVARRAPLSLSGAGLAERVRLPGDDPSAPGGVPEIKFNGVDSNYFSTLGIRLLEGRVFTDADQRAGEPVIIVSDLFARRFFPGTRAVGQRVRIGTGEGLEHRIVGVVEHVVNAAIDEEPEPYFYVPYWRRIYGGETTFLIEAEGDAAALAGLVRGTLRAFNPGYDPRLIATMEELVRYSVRTYRWTALLAAVLGGIGLLLTAIGVYGVVALNTTRRTREIGIRLALGATRGDVLGLVLREGMRLALVGVLIGVPTTLAVGQVLSSLLFGVSPADAISIAGAVALVLVVVLAATLVPARRAVLVAPSSSLRTP